MRAPVYCDNSHTRKPMKELVLKGKEKKMNCLILRFLLFLWLTQKFKVGGFSTFVDITLEKTFSLSEYFGTFDIPVEWWFRLSFDDAFDPPCPPKNQYWIRLFMMKRAQRKFQKGKKDLIEALWLTSTHLQIISTIFWKDKLTNSKWSES